MNLGLLALSIFVGIIPTCSEGAHPTWRVATFNGQKKNDKDPAVDEHATILRRQRPPDFSTELLEAHGMKLVKLKDVHDYNNEFHAVRFIKEKKKIHKRMHMHSRTIQVYGQVDASLKRGSTPAQQHTYCSLASRDNWVCIGDRYEAVLRTTPPYNRSLSLDAFPAGTRIFVEGNSFLAQKVALVLCGSDAEFWKVDGELVNSMLAYDSKRDVGLLMLDNDYDWNPYFNRTTKMLREAWVPTLVVLGDLNGHLDPGRHSNQSESAAIERVNEYSDIFPSVPVIACGGRGLPNNCSAFGQNKYLGVCSKGHPNDPNHQCLPGQSPPHPTLTNVPRSSPTIYSFLSSRVANTANV